MSGSNTPDSSGSRTPPKGGIGARLGGITIGAPDVEKKSKITIGEPEEEKNVKKKTGNVETLNALFLNHLLKPREWSSATDLSALGGDVERFYFRSDHILALVDECQKQIELQPMVLKVKAPVKVFGDIHGQY